MVYALIHVHKHTIFTSTAMCSSTTMMHTLVQMTEYTNISIPLPLS